MWQWMRGQNCAWKPWKPGEAPRCKDPHSLALKFPVFSPRLVSPALEDGRCSRAEDNTETTHTAQFNEKKNKKTPWLFTHLSAVEDVLSFHSAISYLFSNSLTYLMFIKINQCTIKMPITHIYGILDTLKCSAFGRLMERNDLIYWYGLCF